MGIRYENLDQKTRDCMLQESKRGPHYESPRLTPEGLAAWVSLLDTAIEQQKNDDWIAAELLRLGYLRDQETWKFSVRKINKLHTAQMLGEDEFNRFYLRGICVRAKDDGIQNLIVYRGKAVTKPRPESEAKINKPVDVDELLETLRQNDFVSIEDHLAIPGGPNSGLTARLPRDTDSLSTPVRKKVVAT